MTYKVVHVGDEKPLADFYDTECFEVYEEADPELYMAITLGIESWESPKTNIRFAVSLETGRVMSFLDTFEYAPVTVDIEKMGE